VEIVRRQDRGRGHLPGGARGRDRRPPRPQWRRQVDDRGDRDRAYNGYAHAFAGMGVQFILFMGIEIGVGLLLMRRMGLWKRLRAAPVSRGLLLGSRIVSGTLIACLLIAALGKTPEATRGLAILMTLLLVMLGGAWIPTFVFPEWLQTATLWVPTRWAIDGLEAMTWRGFGIEAAFMPVVAMLGASVIFAWVAVRRFTW
jgi:ABC-2 type transport system permease protein